MKIEDVGYAVELVKAKATTKYIQICVGKKEQKIRRTISLNITPLIIIVYDDMTTY